MRFRHLDAFGPRRPKSEDRVFGFVKCVFKLMDGWDTDAHTEETGSTGVSEPALGWVTRSDLKLPWDFSTFLLDHLRICDGK